MLRKTLMGITLLALLATLAPAASAQTVDEVIARNIEAKGGMAKIKAVKSQRSTGKILMGPGMEAPIVMMSRRPSSMRMEFSFQGMTGMQVYDGATAWMSMPFTGKMEPEVMPAEEAKEFAEQADFDGPLVDYKAKGHTVELAGKEQVEGADAFKLKLTMKGGSVRNIYLDAETFLEIKMESKRMIRGTEIEDESYLSDYKEVGGMMMAHVVEQGAKGSPQRRKIMIEQIELNAVIADSLFAMPGGTPAKADSAKTGTAKAGTVEAAPAKADSAKADAKGAVKAGAKATEAAGKKK